MSDVKRELSDAAVSAALMLSVRELEQRGWRDLAFQAAQLKLIAKRRARGIADKGISDRGE
jgi:hypothetical protein